MPQQLGGDGSFASATLRGNLPNRFPIELDPSAWFILNIPLDRKDLGHEGLLGTEGAAIGVLVELQFPELSGTVNRVHEICSILRAEVWGDGCGGADQLKEVE